MDFISEKGDYLIYQIHHSFNNIMKISSIVPVFHTNINNWRSLFDVYFRWSKDGIQFSEWFVLDYELFTIFDDIGLYDNAVFWLHFKFELKNNITANSIDDLKIVYVSKQEPQLFVPFPIEYNVERGNRFYPVQDFQATYQPYRQFEAIRLFKDLTYNNQNMFGIPCKFIRANPIVESKDLFLLEWGLFNYEDPVELKIIIENNEFPSNDLSFNPFGIDFEMPFEVIMDKRYFESYLGIGVSPQQFDVIYIPMVDRIFEVDSSTLSRDFMQEPIYYKLSLRKYSNRTNISSSPDTSTFLDDLTTGISELFENDMRAEENKVINKLQLNEKSSYTDNRICVYDGSLFIKTEELRTDNLLISNNYYDLSTLYPQVDDKVVINYKITNSSNIQNQILTFWNRFPQATIVNKKIRSIVVNDDSIIVNVNVIPPNLKIGSKLSIINENNEVVYYSEITDINKNKLLIAIVRDETLIQYAFDNYPNWLTKVDLLKCGLSHIGKILTNHKDNKGWTVNIVNQSILNIQINDTNYYYYLKHNNNWNAFIIQFLKEFNQISFYQYEFLDRQLNLCSSKILNTIVPNYFNDETYNILGSPIHLTNLRLFTSSIKIEDHLKILYQNIVVDAQNCILIDNALPTFISPFIGQVK